ncbi:hypothetical protein EST38_g2630 [Candolleomyces aberdarensis]|uniref:CRIB domain-containing protein n=1 Tax=Candolleomyces aberdarensis TaxID=2316362 RepID=A0A4Q2DRX9_9AGAR|nr:hypothetical protein EST38_g2630 [Candolleomyces aberdarensis]
MSSLYSVSSSHAHAKRAGPFTTFDVGAPSVHAVANARIYHTNLGSKKDTSPSSSSGEDDWTYSRLKGTLRFGRNWDDFKNSTVRQGSVGGESNNNNSELNTGRNEDQYWFTLSDNATGKTIWMFQIPATGNFLYEVDRPFFHVFNGRTRKYGFLFEDDDDAAMFAKKVINETCKDATPKRGRSTKKQSRSPYRSKSLITPSITRSMISLPAPNSFRHVSHVGVNGAGVFEVSKDLDAAFRENLIKLQNGASVSIVQETDGFVDSFWRDVNRRSSIHQSATSHTSHASTAGPPVSASVAVC